MTRHSFATAEELVTFLRDTLASLPQTVAGAKTRLFAFEGTPLKLAGDPQRVLVLPDGSRRELGPVPPADEPAADAGLFMPPSKRALLGG